MSTHNICFHGKIRKTKISGYTSYLRLGIILIKFSEQFSYRTHPKYWNRDAYVNLMQHQIKVYTAT